MNTVVNASMEPEPISLLALVAWLPSILVATFPPCENLAGCQVVCLVFLVCNVQPSFDEMERKGVEDMIAMPGLIRLRLGKSVSRYLEGRLQYYNVDRKS
ncbi:hypothetical protein BSKO_02580 [Bryopsis sp. KO-2023]|nr:hypothetical protein BSKO_02102 [Bryopsis sp. KO-2023]GMH34719.1 hypothetical protein BSKO_02580 [Bryopsis sp. KO-2023]